MVMWIILALAGVGGGQTTNCQWIGNTWTCNTPQQQPGVDWRSAPRPETNSAENLYDTMQRAHADREAVELQNAQRAAQIKRQELYAYVGKLAAGGDCASASRVALEAGDFELADKVKAYCK
jgi:hypothetical protein